MSSNNTGATHSSNRNQMKQLKQWLLDSFPLRFLLQDYRSSDPSTLYNISNQAYLSAFVNYRAISAARSLLRSPGFNTEDRKLIQDRQYERLAVVPWLREVVDGSSRYYDQNATIAAKIVYTLVFSPVSLILGVLSGIHTLSSISLRNLDQLSSANRQNGFKYGSLSEKTEDAVKLFGFLVAGIVAAPVFLVSALLRGVVHTIHAPVHGLFCDLRDTVFDPEAKLAIRFGAFLGSVILGVVNSAAFALTVCFALTLGSVALPVTIAGVLAFGFIHAAIQLHMPILSVLFTNLSIRIKDYCVQNKVPQKINKQIKDTAQISGSTAVRDSLTDSPRSSDSSVTAQPEKQV